MTVNDVIGRQLVAEKNILVYDRAPEDGGVVIGEIKKGNATATVYSYLQRGNNLYWMFDYTIPGQVPGSYVVLHGKDRFDLLPVGAQLPPNITPSVLDTVTVMPGLPKYAPWILAGVLAALLLKR
jgi:hypothetical protein